MFKRILRLRVNAVNQLFGTALHGLDTARAQSCRA